MYEIYPVPGFAEPVSSCSHLGAAAIFLYLGALLLKRGGVTLDRFLAISVFALSCVFLLSMSGVYHLLPKNGAAGLVLQRLDHAAIFAFIAATFTVVHTIHCTGLSRWGMIVLVWLIAISGIVVTAVFLDRIPESVGTSLYLAFGWLGLVSGKMLWNRYGFSPLKPLLLGGFAYTIGALIELFKHPILVPHIIGPHELFHVAVVLGISYHWYFVHQSLTHLGSSTSLARSS